MVDLRLYGTRVRPIAGYLGYWVGEDGRVWSQKGQGVKGKMDRWFELTLQRQKIGNRAITVHLRKVPGGKLRLLYVHRLVLQAFVGPCPTGMYGLHGDSDTTNNRLENLRWGSPSMNCMDRLSNGTFGTKLTEEQAIALLTLCREGRPDGDVARTFGVTRNHVAHIRLGVSWAHLSGKRTPARNRVKKGN